MAETLTKEAVEQMIVQADQIAYEDALKSIAQLRQEETLTKETTRSLKFNFVEMRSKELFLQALQNELDLSRLNVELPSEEDMKEAKNQSKRIQKQNREMEAKILKQIEQISEYKKIVDSLRCPPDQENQAPHASNLPSPAKTSKQSFTKYQKMLSWYQSVISSIQVLSGISVDSYTENDDSLILTLVLQFNKRLCKRAPHRLQIYFHSESQHLTGASISPSTYPIDDIVEQAVQVDDVKFLVREVRARLIYGPTGGKKEDF